MPSCVLDFKTPLELSSPPFFTSKGVAPKVFGCVCFVHIDPAWGKLEHCALKGIFQGYYLIQKGYKCYHPPPHKLFSLMVAKFSEIQPYFCSTQTPL